MEKRLGRGLEALIVDSPDKAKEKIENLNVKDIVPNQFQPRKDFNDIKMTDLINSIKEKGVIQPVIVRPKDDKYELIAGERRWRAVKELGYDAIPAIIKKGVDDVTSLELSIIENIQREELDPIDEANGYRELINHFGYTLEKVGQMVGKDKTTISNSLRMLSLSAELQKHVKSGKLSTGHAKVLLSVINEHKRLKFAEIIISQGLSVRQTEQLISSQSGQETRKKTKAAKDPEIQRIEEELQRKLGTKVIINHGKKRGHIEIHYYSNNDLDRVIRVIAPGSF
jgi:ParB family chromosome partitioning protein